MKILILIQCTNLGGMEQCMLLLIDEFKKMNIDSEVISIAPAGELKKLLEERGILVTSGGYLGPGGFFSLLEMRKILKSKMADGLLMIGHNLMAEIAIGNLYKGRSALALHFHHRGVHSPWVWRLIYLFATRSFNKLLFTSDYIMREALEIAPFIQDKSLTIGTLVRKREPLSESEKNEAKKTWKIPLDAFVIGNAGWLISRKRWDVFLNVAADVAARVPHARFLIAGDGPERHLLQAQASELGISSRIDWIGWQKNLDSFYKSLDVLLFNSDWDAQPRTPLEAMSYGVPVVASILNGGTQEIIRNDQDGFLMKTHDLGSMADILVRLAEDASYRRILGDQGRLRILEYASPQKYAEVTLRALGLA